MTARMPWTQPRPAAGPRLRAAGAFALLLIVGGGATGFEIRLTSLRPER